MKNTLGVELQAGEECYAIVRCSGLFFLPRLVLGVVWFFLPFMFVWTLWRLGLIGLVIALLFLLTSIWFLRRLEASWRGSGLILTNLRCIDVSRSISGKEALVSEVSWAEVKEAEARMSRLLGWAGLGSVEVHLQEPHSFSFLLPGVVRPRRVAKLIAEVQSLSV